jgi:F-type H+-transporting ATPase subunit delta
MSEIRVASRYAKSLFDLALEKDKLDRIEEDANLFLQTCEHSRAFDNMLKSPIITPDKKLEVVRKIFHGKFNDVTQAFINIVTRKGREMLLVKIFQQFNAMYRQHKNIITATVTTAAPIDNDLKKDFVKMLHNRTNSTIELNTKVNPSVLGGFVLQYEDKLVDASVSSQLKALRNHLLNNN